MHIVLGLVVVGVVFGSPALLQDQRDGTRCIQSCKGQADGDYQSCLGCTVYATCSNGLMYDNRPCPADLVWDDKVKRCEYTSATCPEAVVTDCVSSCAGIKDGDYQSCLGCRVYATCSNELLYDGRPCPSNLVWDDIKKRCEYTSPSCPGQSGGETGGQTEGQTGEGEESPVVSDNDDISGPEGGSGIPVGCIQSCKGQADGDYQSCLGCTVYTTCSNGLIYDNRPCPADLVWDDKIKRCDYTSSTCPADAGVTDCVSSCAGMKDGDYQSCLGCRVYATCSNELLYDGRPCPSNLVWDNIKKRCEYTSPTCPGQSGGQTEGQTGEGEESPVVSGNDEISGPEGGSGTSVGCIQSCKGQADGDYQSCLGCTVYATCSNGLIYDNRPCPADLVWDDKVKRCEYTSTTCPADTGVTDCVSSCAGMKDGDYQSCLGCRVFATCSNELLYDGRPCPANLVWDDTRKRCEYTSPTCPGQSGGQSEGQTEGQTEEGEEGPVVSGNDEISGPEGGSGTSVGCIHSCKGQADGDYQSCLGCTVYATCSNGLIYDNRPCPADLVWDDKIKRCEYTSSTCPADAGVTDCVSSCAGMKDGDYQSCLGCRVYATCSNEILYDGRPCPANLVWDDIRKRCEYTSPTCPGQSGGQTEGQTGEGEESPVVSGNDEIPGPEGGSGTTVGCIQSCKGQADGDYQSCLGCTVYATCSNGLIYDNRPCPADLVWDDNIKRCEYTSSTCPANAGVTDCVSSCAGMKDGDYQSCLGCRVYATCSNELLYDGRPCPANLVWDDIRKRCEYTSPTCPGQTEGQTGEGEESPVVSGNDEISGPEGGSGTPVGCIQSCKGQADGDYQSCLGCTVYTTCSNGLIYDNRPCPADLVWDDKVKRCEYTSSTCPADAGVTDCVSSCVGIKDGDYQSCLGCRVYATCSNELLYDGRPCPANLVWDDIRKRCEYTSPTCPGQSGGQTEGQTEDGEENPGVSGNDEISGPEGDSGTSVGCIQSCKGQADGDYQSCLGCTVYATCSNGLIYDNRPCPAKLVWDDKIKRCEYTSTTCPAEAVVTDCVSSCAGMKDGDYQSCLGCRVYATCSNELLYDGRPCPSNLVWDDIKKRCEYTSPSCPGQSGGEAGGQTDGQTGEGEESPVVSDNDEISGPEGDSGTSVGCIQSCKGQADGDYQSCLGCTVYTTCSNGLIYDNRPCPADLVWDDKVKRCEYTSSTCPADAGVTDCVSSCAGMKDGDYQSCLGCRVYATCSNELLYDGRPCPANLVWDDIRKRCEYTSPTCQDQSQGQAEKPKVDSEGGQSENEQVDTEGQGETEMVTVDSPEVDKSSTSESSPDTDSSRKSTSSKSSDSAGSSKTGKSSNSDKSSENSKQSKSSKSEKGSDNSGQSKSSKIRDTKASDRIESLDTNEGALKTLLMQLNKLQRGNTYCVTSCVGNEDGDYQSCLGCHVYVTCSNKILHDERPCPTDLVWDDNKKRCEWTSTTCGTKPPSCERKLSCSSWGYKYEECAAPGSTVMSVSLVKQLSKTTCTFGKTFGVKNNGIWVNNGCRGDFSVCACSEVKKVDCDSWNFKYAKCPVGGANAVLDVNLVCQKSKSKCEMGSSYGVEGGSICVDHGCRAVFNVCV